MSKPKFRGPSQITGHTERQLLPDAASKVYVDNAIKNGGSGLPAGTNDGDVPVWDTTLSAWSPQTIDAALPPGDDGDVLQHDGTQWFGAPLKASQVGAYSTAEIDQKMQNVISGVEHSAAVVAVTDTPPTSPTALATYIVGKTPTGAWVGQKDKLAEWDGTKWVFTAPLKGEAHFAEETNETWHWNDKEWVKVGKSVLNLGDLDDVDTGTPADGATLKFSNKQWRMVPKVTLGITHEFHPQVHTAGQHGVLDIGETDWHRLDIEGIIETADAPTHLTWVGMDAAGNPVMLTNDLARQATQLVYGRSGIAGRGFYALDREWTVGASGFSLTWLAGAAGSNDRVSHTVGNYSPFEVRVQRMYDNFLVVQTSLMYVSYGAEIYTAKYTWAFRGSEGNKKLQKIAVVPQNGSTRIAVNGQFTLH